MSGVRAIFAAAVLVSLAACQTIEPKIPAVELPDTSGPTVPGIERWWTQFNDPQLNALIDETLAANLDLRTAVARIEEARATLRFVRANLYPTLDAEVIASRGRRSEAVEPSFPGPTITNTYTAGVVAAYEVDLWGRLASARSAAQADLLATQYSAETVRTVLAAQVASTYFTLRGFDAELRISRDTLASRVNSVNLQKQRLDAGLISEYELRLADAERATVASSIPPLERAIAQTEAALATLTGRSARGVFTPIIARGNELLPLDRGPEVPAGLPSDLLARRPDVRQAEASLVAASARINEARAQYFPSLFLTARFGSESSELSDLFSGPAAVWSIAGNILQPIFNAGRIGAQVDAATAQQTQAEIDYVRVVQSAFRDAHDALVAHRSARASIVAQEERRARLLEAFNLAELRNRSGYTSYLDVLATERDLLDAERARVIALRERQNALVDLYKALGGGWSPEQFASNQ
jgi:multidrug efflux system outer membrane protein